MTVLAWHFTGDRLRDGSPIPPAGEWLEFAGEVVICKSGLHASRDPFDALQYAPGPILCRVECDEIVTEHDDKFVCRRRRIIKNLDATDGLRYFARMQALSVVHRWNAPDVVLDYLMTGDESIRAAARAAAWDAARAPAWAAAKAAAWDAARAPAWAAAWAAASDTAWATAWDAASDTAWATAWDAARANFNALVNEAFGEEK